MVYVVLMIVNLGLGPKIETTGIVCVTDSYEVALIEKERAETVLKGDGRRFEIQTEPLLH
jgi:hypothetical protein